MIDFLLNLNGKNLMYDWEWNKVVLINLSWHTNTTNSISVFDIMLA